jgi:NIMA (never in mitosis gene a)-related kinase
VIHRDIKPQNILITGDETFKIGDLGISRHVNNKNKQLHESKIGTPLYASPELIRRQPYDYKTDMWALGCVMHYMACLEHPFLANPIKKGHHFNRQ